MRVPRQGRRAWQPFYRRLHRLALRGMNYGEYELAKSGEAWALAWAADTRPGQAVVFDIGANVGTWSLRARAAWPMARIFAFEPSPDIHATLALNVASSAITTVCAAASSQSGMAPLFEVEGISELASLHQRDLQGHGLTVTKGPSVPTITLDEFCAANSVEHIDYLKIDTEGHELAVLQGAKELLRESRISIVQFEFGGTDIDSRTFLRDFVQIFEPTYGLYRLVRNGMEPLVYSETAEVFVTSHFLAVARNG